MGRQTLQIGFKGVLEGFIGLAGDESFAEDAVTVDEVSDWTRDIGFDVKASNAGAWVDAPFDERHAGEFSELGLLLGGLVGDSDDDESVFCIALLEALEQGHFLAAGQAPGGPQIQKNNLATKVGQRAGRFVSNELELEIRRNFVSIAEDGL
jgi:hypothetical protein